MTMLMIHIDMVLFICLVWVFCWGGGGGIFITEKRGWFSLCGVFFWGGGGELILLGEII